MRLLKKDFSVSFLILITVLLCVCLNSSPCGDKVSVCALLSVKSDPVNHQECRKSQANNQGWYCKPQEACIGGNYAQIFNCIDVKGNSVFVSNYNYDLDKSFEHVFRSIRAKMAEVQPSKDLDYLNFKSLVFKRLVFKRLVFKRLVFKRFNYLPFLGVLKNFEHPVPVHSECPTFSPGSECPAFSPGIIIIIILGLLSKTSAKITRKYYEILANINWKKIKSRGFRKTHFLKRKRVINKAHQKVKTGLIGIICILNIVLEINQNTNILSIIIKHL